jgi:hypothetical protein
MEYPVPGARDQAVLAELGKVLADGEFDDLAGKSDRGREWVRYIYRGHHWHLFANP